jgi:uncharacterized protein
LILCDVNVLIYAYRSDSHRHAEYKAWLEDSLSGPAPFGVSPQVLASVVRICTDPKVFANPDVTADVIAFCDSVLAAPNVGIVTPGDRHWSLFSGLCRSSNARGNLIQDAWFAALAVESGCTWITTDGDYGRFPGLEWRAPLQPDV